MLGLWVIPQAQEKDDSVLNAMLTVTVATFIYATLASMALELVIMIVIMVIITVLVVF